MQFINSANRNLLLIEFYANLLLKDVKSSLQLVHITTIELPRYFAVVTQLSLQVAAVSADGGLICTPQGTKVSFPPDACWRSTNVAVKVSSSPQTNKQTNIQTR